MRKWLAVLVLLLPLGLGACGDDDDKAKPPPPKEPTSESMARYCNMVVIEHPGPKGQILLKSTDQPIWFATVRDAVVFTLLPEEPKDIAAIYVNDMGKANWASPEPGTWIEARDAWFVIESTKKSGMNTAEAVPFADKAKAEKFVQENGGRVVAWKDIPRDYVLEENAADATQPANQPMDMNHADHDAMEQPEHSEGDHQ